MTDNVPDDDFEQRIKTAFVRLDTKIQRVTDKTKGCNQVVKVVETNSGKYVIKFPHDPSEVYRTVFAYERLKDMVPIPRVVDSTEDYVIELYIEGDDLDEVTLDYSTARQVYSELGSILKRIHTVQGEGFGLLQEGGRGTFGSIRESVQSLFDGDNPLEGLENIGLVQARELSMIASYLEKNDSHLTSDETFL